MIKLDSILLFALVIPFIMSVSLSPGKTPYWLFFVIFLALASYFILDLLKLTQKSYNTIKNVLLWGVVLIVIGSAFSSAIVIRHKSHPTNQIHDMPLQQEIAIRFLLEEKNPYNTSYFGTFLEQWHYSSTEKNPALYHFVLPPFYILFAVPFYFLSNQFLGYFDARIPLLFLFFVLLATINFLVKDAQKKRLFLILLAFHPAMLLYALEGRSDIFMFAFLVLGLFLLNRKRYAMSGIPIALAFAVKQSVWPFFPFYAAFLYLKTKDIKKTIFSLLPFTITLFLITAPFFLWDQKAFLDSTIFYLSGSTENSYPISGYGFGKLLEEVGYITNLYAYYPFIIWQLIIGLPVFLILLRFLRSKPDMRRLIFSYGIFLFVFWYFSRYFNNSHLAYLSMVFITAYFWPEEVKNT